MSTQTIEAQFEAADDRPQSERELDTYLAAVQDLDPEDVLYAACGTMALQAPALMELVQLQLQHPYEDVSLALIHPSQAQAIARQCLEAIAASIDCLASVHQVVEARA